ncbi:MAG: polysaccharide biosynthesis tyrosine autokinase [Gemmatimonadaceae bacterium]
MPDKHIRPIQTSATRVGPVKAVPAPYRTPDQQSSRVDGASLQRMFEVLRHHAGIIAALTLLTAGITAYLLSREVPKYRANAVVQLVAARDLLPKDADTRASDRAADPRVDPVLSQLMVLQGRGVLGEVVDTAGLRLTLRSGKLSSSDLTNVQVALPPLATDVVRLAFGSEVTARTGQQEAQASYGAPVALGGVQFTVPTRPADVKQATLVVVPREDAIDSVAKALRATPKEGTNGVEVEFTSGDSASAVRVVNAVVNTFQQVDARTSRQAAKIRRAFLEEQLRATDSLLASAQGRLTQFQSKAQVYSSHDQIVAQQNNMLQLDTRRGELEADRHTYQTLLNGLNRPGRSELPGLASGSDGSANPAIAQLYTQLVQYQTLRDSLTAGEWGRAPTNPDVIRADQLIGSTRARLGDAMHSQITALSARISGLDEMRGRTGAQIQALPSAGAEEARLGDQLSTLKTTGDELRSEYQKARIAEAVQPGQVNIVSLASRAQLVGTHRSVRLLFGVLLGLLLGVGGAFLLDPLNTSIRRREEIEPLLQIPGLAVIPQVGPSSANVYRIPGFGSVNFRRLSGRFPAFGENGDSSGNGSSNGNGNGNGVAEENAFFQVDQHPSYSPAAEAYRSLRTNLIFSQVMDVMKTLVITSPVGSDGKTTTSINLATAFAQQGMRVLLMDCDLRRSRLAKAFGIPSEPGLTDVLLNLTVPALAIHPGVSGGLDVLPCGTPRHDPSELLGSQQMKNLVEQLSDQYDLVIMDTPPVLAASDAAVLAAKADGVLLVLRAGETDRSAAQYALQQLASVHANVIGAVLNDPDVKYARYGGYYDQSYATAK